MQHTGQLQVETERERQLAAITEADVRRTLQTLARNLEDIAHESQDLLKEFLRSIGERIELHPTDLTCRIQYRISQHELSSVEVRHFIPADAQIIVPGGKTGGRVVTLTPEGVAFFKRVARGKTLDAVLLPRADGERWGKSQQHRPIKAALNAARLPLTATMYALRHTYISRAIERGTPLTLVAENCGTSVRMIEETYAKTIAKVRRDLIARTAPTLRSPRSKRVPKP